MFTIEYYEDVNVNGVLIMSRRGIKGNEKDGMLELIEIIGGRRGEYRGKKGYWKTGEYYDVGKFTHEQAMKDFQKRCLPKFEEVINGDDCPLPT